MRRVTRRTFLVASAGAVVAACGPSGKTGAQTTEPATTAALQPRAPVPTVTSDGASSATQAPAPSPTPTPVPPPPKGTIERIALEGTNAATSVIIHHSGLAGPSAVVLGGVHGNEPGAWVAADEVATWMPARGTLVVIPRCNVLAIADFARTTDAIGDLNRLYPGNPGSELLMERMAAVITGIAAEFKASLLLDMHESWAFFREYEGRGAAALGQTITAGVGPLQATFAQDLRDRVNGAMTDREQMLVRDGTQFSRPPATPTPGQTNRGRSSLAAGGAVAGLTPVLVEMGQEHQEIERRTELHLIVARAALELVGVL